MTQMKLPPPWATNTNFSSGPDAGTPTKIDPATSDNGFVRGTVAAAQHVNFLFEKYNGAGRRAFEIAALHMRRIDLEGTAITDTAESMAAVQRNQGTPLVACKTAQALALSDWSRFVEYGVPVSITSLVVDAATDGSRIAIIGTGGNRIAYSDDDGATWTAGANLDAVASRIISTGATTWYVAPTTTSGGFERVKAGSPLGWIEIATTIAAGTVFNGMGFVAGDPILCYDDASGPVFQIEPGGGFNDSGGTVDNAGDFDEGGSMVGVSAEDFVYHCGRLNSGATIQVSKSNDGAAWTTLASLTPQGSASFSGRPRILACQNTGLLVIVAPTSGSEIALFASLDGSDWVGPTVLFPAPGVAAYALAGGRLMATFDDMLFASDGVGFDD